MFELPTSITIDGDNYPIRNQGDFRMVLDCFKCLQDIELTEQERILVALCIFYEDVAGVEYIQEVFNTDSKLVTAVEEMYNFFNCGQESVGAARNHKLIDWEKDSQVIVSAINNVAKKEIRAETYIHWWTFMGYYLAIGECPLSTIVNIRDKIVRGKKLEKWEQDFKLNNPEYFNWNFKSVEEEELDNYIRELWNKGD
jgi:hypothetical protein